VQWRCESCSQAYMQYKAAATGAVAATACPRCARAKQNRKVARAYLVRGGDSPAERQRRAARLDDGAFFMLFIYTNSDKTEVAFLASEKPESFYGMTFEEAKMLAGNDVLPSNFTGPAWCDFKAPTRGIICIE